MSIVPVPIPIKYETDQARIIQHAGIWVDVLIFPIMANIDAIYAMATTETKSFIYNLCVQSDEIANICEYNNLTNRLNLPNTFIYPNLTIVRVYSDNLLNITGLMSEMRLPSLRTLDVITISPETLLVGTITHPTLEEFTVKKKEGSKTLKMEIKEIMTRYPRLQSLTLIKCSIRLSGRICSNLILKDCDYEVGRIDRMPETLTINNCRKSGKHKLTATRSYEIYTSSMMDIIVGEGLESLTIASDDNLSFDVPSVRTLKLINVISPIPNEVKVLTYSSLGKFDVPPSVERLNLSKVNHIDVDQYINLKYLLLEQVIYSLPQAEIIERCVNLELLDLNNCGLDRVPLNSVRPNLVLRHYDTPMNEENVERLVIKEYHNNRMHVSEAVLKKIEAKIKRVSLYSFSIMQMVEFVRFCEETYLNKEIPDYEMVFHDVAYLAATEPNLFLSYYSYFVTARYNVPEPEDDFVYRSLITHGNPVTRISFDDGVSISLYTIADIRADKLTSPQFRHARKRYVKSLGK